MNDFISIVQWSTIIVLLFLSGSELIAQIIEKHVAWSQADYSLIFFCCLMSFLIYQIGKLFSSTEINKLRAR